MQKFRIETSVRLLHHELNEAAEVISVSNDDDDVKVMENNFSYDTSIFNAALPKESGQHVFSTPPYIDRTESDLSGFDPDDEVPQNDLSGSDRMLLNVENPADDSRLESTKNHGAPKQNKKGTKNQRAPKQTKKGQPKKQIKAVSGDTPKVEGSNVEGGED